jgi:pimeloyl-ACP methyl ester carboxylesterase
MSNNTTPTAPWTERRLVIDGLDTYFLEAGDREAPCVVMLAYSGPGAAAEEAFEFNIGSFAEHFRVIAPDLPGCGKTAKVVSLTDNVGFRVRHLAVLLETLGVDAAHFVGASTTGSIILREAVRMRPRWPIDRIIGVSAVGPRAGPLEFPKAMGAFFASHSIEDMDRILQFIFPTRWWDEAYLARRVRWALEPGAWEGWEADAGALRGFPADHASSPLSDDADVQFETIRNPVLLVGGGSDQLRPEGCTEEYAARIPDCRFAVYPDAGHLPHIDHAEDFNRLGVEFLTGD